MAGMSRFMKHARYINGLTPPTWRYYYRIFTLDKLARLHSWDGLLRQHGGLNRIHPLLHHDAPRIE